VISRPDQGGFALIEAIVALGLLSIVGGAAMAFAFVGMRSIEACYGHSASAAALSAMDDCFRKSALAVRIPYWERGAGAELDSKGVSIPYLEGEEDSRLEIGWKEKALSLSAFGEKRTFRAIEEPRIDILKSARGAEVGLKLEFTLRGKRYSIAAFFGEAPL
jgi:hypothetical protein